MTTSLLERTPTVRFKRQSNAIGIVSTQRPCNSEFANKIGVQTNYSPLALFYSVAIALRIAQRRHVYSLGISNLLFSSVPQKYRLASPLEGHLLTRRNVGEINLCRCQRENIFRGVHHICVIQPKSKQTRSCSGQFSTRFGYSRTVVNNAYVVLTEKFKCSESAGGSHEYSGTTKHEIYEPTIIARASFDPIVIALRICKSRAMRYILLLFCVVCAFVP